MSVVSVKDQKTVRRLYEATGRAAILKTARLVGRLAVAEEIVQSAFLRLWQSGLEFADERMAYAWIYRACHNAGIDHLRAHATRFEGGVSSEELGSFGGDADDQDLVADRQWLAQKLATLTEREAQVLAYRVVDGMTQQEIAEVMGLSRKTVVRECAAVDDKLGLEKGGS